MKQFNRMKNTGRKNRKQFTTHRYYFEKRLNLYEFKNSRKFHKIVSYEAKFNLQLCTNFVLHT